MYLRASLSFTASFPPKKAKEGLIRSVLCVIKAQKRRWKNQRQISFLLTFVLHQLLSLCILNKSLHWLPLFRVKSQFRSIALSRIIKCPYLASQPCLFLSIIPFRFSVLQPNYICPDSQQAHGFSLSYFYFNILSACDTLSLIHPSPISPFSSLLSATHP